MSRKIQHTISLQTVTLPIAPTSEQAEKEEFCIGFECLNQSSGWRQQLVKHFNKAEDLSNFAFENLLSGTRNPSSI